MGADLVYGIISLMDPCRPFSDARYACGLLIAREGSQLAVQSSDTIGSPVVLILRFTRPTAKRGLTVGFYVEPVLFLNLGF
jgi:hypothetical protein